LSARQASEDATDAQPTNKGTSRDLKRH